MGDAVPTIDRDPAVHKLLVRKILPRQASVISVTDLPDLLRAG